jgi:hypothetical protein
VPRLQAQPRCTRAPFKKIARDINEDARNHARSLKGTPAFERSSNARKKVEMRFAHLKVQHGRATSIFDSIGPYRTSHNDANDPQRYRCSAASSAWLALRAIADRGWSCYAALTG